MTSAVCNTEIIWKFQERCTIFCKSLIFFTLLLINLTVILQKREVLCLVEWFVAFNINVRISSPHRSSEKNCGESSKETLMIKSSWNIRLCCRCFLEYFMKNFLVPMWIEHAHSKPCQTFIVKLFGYLAVNDFHEKFLNIWDALRNLVPSVQLKRREKHPWMSVKFSKDAGWIIYFSHFLNWIYGTKSRIGSHMFNLLMVPNTILVYHYSICHGSAKIK